MIAKLLRRWFDRSERRADSTRPVPTAPSVDAPASPHSSAPAAPRPVGTVRAPHPAARAEAQAAEISATFTAAVGAFRARLDEARGDVDDVRALLDRVATGPAAELRRIPAAANAILAATRDLDAPRAKLVGLVERDPAIAQALLRAVNSAAFHGGGPRIASLGHALDRLGMASTRAVVLHQSLTGLICRPGGDLDVMAKMVWTHMTDSAEIARRLAPAFDADPDAAFATALLHDVGKLVIFDHCSTLRRDLRRPIHLRPELLSELLGGLHAPLGAVAASHWEMPDPMIRAIASHHRTEPEAGPEPLAEAVFLAERVDLARRRGADPALATWWVEGRLAGTPDRVATLLETPAAA